MIDALTAETMTLREEAATLQVRRSLPTLSQIYYSHSNCTHKCCLILAGCSQAVMQWQTAGLEKKLDTILLSMGGLGLLEQHADLPLDSNIRAPGPYTLYLSFHGIVVICEYFVYTVINYWCTVCQSAPVPERLPQQTQVAASPALLLSPPRQRDNSQNIPSKSHFFHLSNFY